MKSILLVLLLSCSFPAFSALRIVSSRTEPSQLDDEIINSVRNPVPGYNVGVNLHSKAKGEYDPSTHWNPKHFGRQIDRKHTDAYERIRSMSGFGPYHELAKKEFDDFGKTICAKHKQQTPDDHARLTKKWTQERPVLEGEVDPWVLLQKLALTVDRSDTMMLTTNQFQHVQQIWEGMVLDGVTDSKMLCAAMLHDFGKLISLYGEEHHNADCLNELISQPTNATKGGGISQVMPQWNHDEFGYTKLKPYVSDEMAFVIRYHSLIPLITGELDYVLNEKETEWLDTLRLLEEYDHKTKSKYRVPDINITTMERSFRRCMPAKIVF